MPNLETPEELADEIADLVGIYGGHEDGESKTCRVCFVSGFADRIRQSVKNEERLQRAE